MTAQNTNKYKPVVFQDPYSDFNFENDGNTADTFVYGGYLPPGK